MHPSDNRRKRHGMTLSERLVLQRVSRWKGVTVLRNGWPDFLVIPETGPAYCLEVKTRNEPVTAAQTRMHAALQKLGIVTLVVRDGWCKEAGMRLADQKEKL